MKKINNGKFRNNNSSSNTIYSLNYKFDSVCSAGKFCGTALDLIKKYNELAKEAHSNGDYVEMEVFRQYAEHYRKIVTEINERKNQQRENNQPARNTEEVPAENAPVADNGLVETEAAPQETPAPQTEEAVTDKPVRRRRSFKIVTVGAEKNSEATGEEMPTAPVAEEKPAKRRPLIRKPRAPKEPENAE
jgi:hypothetical protein